VDEVHGCEVEMGVEKRNGGCREEKERKRWRGEDGTASPCNDRLTP
jgi:hypothetical protein